MRVQRLVLGSQCSSSAGIDLRQRFHQGQISLKKAALSHFLISSACSLIFLSHMKMANSKATTIATPAHAPNGILNPQTDEAARDGAQRIKGRFCQQGIHNGHSGRKLKMMREFQRAKEMSSFFSAQLHLVFQQSVREPFGCRALHGRPADAFPRCGRRAGPWVLARHALSFPSRSADQLKRLRR